MNPGIHAAEGKVSGRHLPCPAVLRSSETHGFPSVVLIRRTGESGFESDALDAGLLDRTIEGVAINLPTAVLSLDGLCDRGVERDGVAIDGGNDSGCLDIVVTRHLFHAAYNSDAMQEVTAT